MVIQHHLASSSAKFKSTSSIPRVRPFPFEFPSAIELLTRHLKIARNLLCFFVRVLVKKEAFSSHVVRQNDITLQDTLFSPAQKGGNLKNTTTAVVGQKRAKMIKPKHHDEEQQAPTAAAAEGEEVAELRE